MPKVYKSNNKLAVSIPYELIAALGLKDGDDLDFLKYGDNTFLVVKKNDIVKMLAKANADEPAKPAVKQQYAPRSSAAPNITVTDDELALLKKLDTLKYNDRTSTKVAAMLNGNEKTVLQALLKKGIVVPFKKAGDKDSKYSIQKSFYDTFLYRKGKEAGGAQPEATTTTRPKAQQSTTRTIAVAQKAWEQASDADSYTKILEAKGYIVVSNEADASMVSTALESSIRQGLVVGTRAFNKKFYIGLRGYINRHASRILKVIDQQSMNIEDIAKELSLDEDGVRTILYFLSESGDVTEVKRDKFRAA